MDSSVPGPPDHDLISPPISIYHYRVCLHRPFEGLHYWPSRSLCLIPSGPVHLTALCRLCVCVCVYICYCDWKIRWWEQHQHQKQYTCIDSVSDMKNGYVNKEKTPTEFSRLSLSKVFIKDDFFSTFSLKPDADVTFNWLVFPWRLYQRDRIGWCYSFNWLGCILKCFFHTTFLHAGLQLCYQQATLKLIFVIFEEKFCSVSKCICPVDTLTCDTE